jgi:excisionase family DNA binding protein
VPTPATATLAGELLTIEQAAAQINMSTRYVRRLIAERRIVTYRFGRAVRLHTTDLDAYVLANRVEPITVSSVWRDLDGVA